MIVLLQLINTTTIRGIAVLDYMYEYTEGSKVGMDTEDGFQGADVTAAVPCCAAVVMAAATIAVCCYMPWLRICCARCSSASSCRQSPPHVAAD